jgi:hypothetical protein
MKKTKRMFEDENLEYENEYNEDDDRNDGNEPIRW